MIIKTNTLFAKFAGALLVLFLVVGGVTLAVTLFTSYYYQQEVQQRIHQDLAAHIVEEELLIENGQIAEEALKHVFHMMMVINPTIELYLLDPDGAVLAYSAPLGKVKLAQVELAPIETFVSGVPRLPLLGDDPRHPERTNIFSASPIRREGILEGYLYIVLGSEHFVGVADMMRGSYILRTGAWAVAGSVVIMLIGALLLSRHLTRRLTRLNRDIRRFRAESLDGAKDPELESDNSDEVRQLRVAFEAMVERIKEQIDQLEDQDRLRREMVANVSHDLRTPLTHLQGYLETLALKEESLDPAERREYLDIALQHGERLGRLISDLFELAKLDALHEPIECESLPIGELVQDVAQKYRLPAQERGVDLNARLEGGATRISADFGLIERALENILENALRYTPSGGSIDINLETSNDRLSIEIRDTGPGIAESEVSLVFDRFYQAPSNKGDSARGAGLGLAIAKRAVELHGGNLSCDSRVGQGTTFSFDLPAG